LSNVDAAPVHVVVVPPCADCGGVVGQDHGPPDGWQLEDGRTVCHACCAKDTKEWSGARMETRLIVGRSANKMYATMAAEYMNERFVSCGAIVESSGNRADMPYLITLQGPVIPNVQEASVQVEACRAVLSALPR